MQLSQKLKSILDILKSNVSKELSYNKECKFLTEDKITNKNYSIIKEKYRGFELIKGVTIYNMLSGRIRKINNLPYCLLNINLYKDNFFTNFFWNNVEKGVIIKTFFQIENSQTFINSLLEKIDYEKETLNIFKEQEQVNNIELLIKTSIDNFGVDKFPINIKIKDYITSHNQYYKTIKSLNNKYKIENVQIFNGFITYTLSKIKDYNINISIKNGNLYIDNSIIEFKTKTTKIYNLFKLIFNYYSDNNCNTVTFYELKEYYINNKNIYTNIDSKYFNYEGIRKSLSDKNNKIKNKHNLKTDFITINTSGIQCPNFNTER